MGQQRKETNTGFSSESAVRHSRESGNVRRVAMPQELFEKLCFHLRGYDVREERPILWGKLLKTAKYSDEILLPL